MSGRTTKRAGVDKEKAWASGRVLTPEQRARKQDADRKANRFLKKEVQDRLALLEERVLQLESEASTATASGLTTAGLGVNVPSTTLPGAGALSSSTNTTSHGSMTTSPGKVLQWDDMPNGAGQFDCSQLGISQSPGVETLVEGLPRSSAIVPAVSAAAYFPGSDALTPAIQTQTKNPWSPATSSARPRAEGRDLTNFLNNLVKHIRSISPGSVCFDDRYNQDVIITAVLKGWPALSKYQQQCPLWAVLQMVDQCLFKDINLVERISVLRMLHLRYLSEVNVHLPTVVEGPLPPWFSPQATEVVVHEPVVEHLTWPRLRERLMGAHINVLTNKFWTCFARNLRVSWQREPLDVIAFSPDSHLYQLSPEFESSLFDMRSWRMDTQFFQEYPGLSGDIPPDSYVTMRTITPKFGVAEMVEAEKAMHPDAQHRRATFHGDPRQRFMLNPIEAVPGPFEPIRQFQPVVWNEQTSAMCDWQGIR
ncbi:uncharacterized protein RCC_03056 [Ramularia collo-cygni]|uniref:Uncharacterized protein n=1 Tax=Ramularia collo-cygni TaxID=112498 RepID=A0A2D3V9X5_9PEZI|nr:uncharacterized protein RCC_03056 [Ramularia collo-cygni]CZT17223.1 uncharacterized protein RCC_03056 [Ramularia collo-cygni]